MTSRLHLSPTRSRTERNTSGLCSSRQSWLIVGSDTPLHVTADEHGNDLPGDQVIRNAIEEAVLADEVGVDSFNVSEHYREKFMDSAGAGGLAGVASRTKRIRLGTAVTVLSTQDPRLFTAFSTLDAISDGRAQIALGAAR